MSKVNSSVGDEGAGDDPMVIAQELVGQALAAIHRALKRIDGGEPEAAGELPKAYKELKAALEATFAERRRLDEQRRKHGELGDGEVDLDAARIEVRDCLARVRASRGG